MTDHTLAPLPATSRYAYVDGECRVAFGEEELAPPGPNRVIVRIAHVGVCATDTHAYASGGFIPPAVFGHEWAGTVVAVGQDVTTVAPGDRVVASVGPACGACAMCRAGVPTIATGPLPRPTVWTRTPQSRCVRRTCDGGRA